MIAPQELLFSVDEHNNPIDPQPRALSHRTGIWHRVAHIWIVNSANQILCQQRSLLKDLNPGRWEPFFGGHLAPGQEYGDGAATELKEELGIEVSPAQLTYFREYRYELGTEYQGIFILRWDGGPEVLHLEKDEVEQVAWKLVDEIEPYVIDESDQQWSHIGYESEILTWISEHS